MTFQLAAIAMMAFLLAVAEPTLASFELWDSMDVTVPLSDGGFGLPSVIRFQTEARNGAAYSGLGQLNFRVGPSWELRPHFTVATHYVAVVDQASQGGYSQEHRADVEPTYRMRWSAWTFSDRNRVEYRWRQGGPRWRYRNRIGLSYLATDARWGPFFGNEVLVDLSGKGFNENRLQFGVGVLLNGGARLNVGMMGRSTLSGGDWNTDFVMQLGVSFIARTEPIY